MLPEWMPNMHPMVVHFPIALLVVAFLVDIVALFFRRISMLARMATILYVLGALGALGGVISGEYAAETVEVSGQASSILADHEDAGELAMKYFLVYAALRIALWWWLSFRLVFWIPLAVIGGIGLLPLFQASSFGGRLVYEQGVGVVKADSLAMLLQEKERALVRAGGTPEFSGIQEDGGWQWQAGANAVNIFNSAFEVITGAVTAETVRDSDGNSLLALTVEQSPVIIAHGISVSNVEFAVTMDLSDFNGTVRLMHHVQDSLSYHFMEVGKEMIRLGAVVSGEEEIQEESSLPQLSEDPTFRVVGAETHFRGYVAGDLVVHGHGSAPEAGVAGLSLTGAGTIKVGQMQLVVLH